jgi:DsbC/DsbD-like thiol-disulfide interchange protein
MQISLLGSAAIALCLSSTAFAGTDSFNLDDVARLDILPGWRTASGSQMTALRIRLAPGWKTYWRAPGTAGIPPRFDWEGSQNIKGVEFHWPTPNVYYVNGLRTVGYKDELILPMEFTPDRAEQPITLRANIELGVCQDVCLPVTVRVAADLTATTDPDPRISAAIAAAPITARAAGMRKVTCNVEPISDGLRLTATIDMPTLGQDEVAIFELSDQTIWIAEADAQRTGPTLTATTDMVPPSNAPFALNRSDVRITVLGGGQGVDIMGCTTG